MSYLELKIEINAKSEEIISDFLMSDLGFCGIILEEETYIKKTRL